MLGAKCSPCCGPTCSASDIDEFWTKMLSAGVTLEVSGTSDERDAISVHYSAYENAPAQNRPQHWGEVTVYEATSSPMQTMDMALLPPADFDPFNLNITFRRGDYDAQVVYFGELNGIEARLKVYIARFLGDYQYVGPKNLNLPGNICFGQSQLYLKQSVRNRTYESDSSFGSTSYKDYTGINGFTATARYYTNLDYTEGNSFQVFNFLIPTPTYLTGIRLGDVYAQSIASPIRSQAYDRYYFFNEGASQGVAVSATSNESSLTLSFAAEFTSGLILDGLYSSSLSSFRPASFLSPGEPAWGSTFPATWSVPGSSESTKRLYSSVPYYNSELFIAQSLITPSARFVFP
jgi:hypothetical protein